MNAIDEIQFSTFEDTYNAVVETERGIKEKIRIYEVGGTAKIERHLVNCTDAFILVCDSSQVNTFHFLQNLKQAVSFCYLKFYIFCF